jgi:hypothetical protein
MKRKENGRAEEPGLGEKKLRLYDDTCQPVTCPEYCIFFIFLMLYWCFAFFNESGVTRACRAQRFVAACERHPCPGMHVALLMLPFIGNTTRGLSFFQFK